MRSIAVARSAAAVAIASIAVSGVASTAHAAKPFNGAVVKKSSLPANRIKPNSLTGVQINEARLGVVPAAKLSNFAELAKSADSAKVAEIAKFAETARTAETARSAETARTAQDAQKLNGRDHTAFLANSVRTVSEQLTVATGTGATLVASCSPDEMAIGGGAVWLQVGTENPTQLNAPITATMPVPSTPGVNAMTGWKAAGYNTTGGSRTLRVYATCVPRTA